MLPSSEQKIRPDAQLYREIITKAVCGNAKKYFQISKIVEPPAEEQLSQILGFTVPEFQIAKKIDISSTLEKQKSVINISGVFNTHIWCAYNNGKTTNVIKTIVPFNEVVPIACLACGEVTPINARVGVIKEPEFLDAVITKDNKIEVKIKLGVLVEVIGETRIKVCIHQH